MRFVLADAGEAYARGLEALIGYFLERRFTHDWPIYGCRVPATATASESTSGQLVAVAGVTEPEPFVENEAHERAWSELREQIGSASIERLEYYERESDGDAPVGPHHFLGIIGVHPHHQGHGHARALIEHIMDECRAHTTSRGVWLSTETDENVPFYEHLGFRVAADRNIGSIRYRVMVWNRG